MGIGGVVDHIDILVTQFAHDTVYTATLHTHAGAYGINTVIEALHGNLSTLSRHTSHLTDSNQSVSNLGNLGLKQALQELWTGTAQQDAGIIVLVLHLFHHGTHSLALAVVVCRNLITLQQVKLVALIVHEQHLALPQLIDLTTDHSAHLILVLLIESIVVKLQDF